MGKTYNKEKGKRKKEKGQSWLQELKRTFLFFLFPI